MKKIIFIISFFIFSNVNAIELKKCIDGDTATFTINEENKTVRFLAIDTPEYTKEKEEYGKEASEFTCNMLKNAKTIRLESDPKSDDYDKYGRMLAWVFIDDVLLQEELLKNGLAEIKYIYGDYKYLNKLEVAEKIAIKNKLGIWKEEKQDYTTLITIITLSAIFIIVYEGNIKKTTKKVRKIMKNKLK